MGSRTRVGLKGLVPTTTQTQTSGTDYNHLTLDPVTPGCSMAPPLPPPTICALVWSWGFSVPI